MNRSRRFFLGTSLAAVGALTIARPSAQCSDPPEDSGPLPQIVQGGPIRPPGALPEKEFRARCISCGVCVGICRGKRFDALTPAPHGTRSAFGAPRVVDMRDFPCTLCMECPPRCPTGALRKVEKEDVRMGMALIDLGLCFGWNGDVCLSCSKACPLGAKVFDFHYGQWGNQPYINEACVGCGLCVKFCPLGGSAIKVVTRERYKEVRDDYLVEVNGALQSSVEKRYRIVYERNLPRIMARGRLVEREYR